MSLTLLTIEIKFEQDVVMTRQRAGQIAILLGFESQDKTRIATAVSEIGRNAFQYAGGGKVKFWVEISSPQILMISIEDRGQGIANLNSILDGQYTSTTGMGLGIIGSKRLMDIFRISSSPGEGTIIEMGKTLPKLAPILTAKDLGQLGSELAMRSPQSPFEEIQQQNQELLFALEDIRQREEQLIQLNRELEDTNRGVVALYAELDEKADSLQKANEVKTRFLSNMSHEFRTPLNSIISLSRMLLDRMDGELTAEQEKQVTFIRKSAEGLSDLVNDLLDLAKVEAGKIVVLPNEFEVSDLFGALRGMLRPLLAYNSSVSLVFQEPVGIPKLYTDEGKVSQILRNFISNALKYTEFGEVLVSAAIAGNTIIFSVADTGIGIAPGDRERIFEEYTQVYSPLQTQFKGTGLGLPLAKKLAELLGGGVFLSSEVGKGSTFFATIPLVYESRQEEAKVENFSCQLNSALSPILVIEDNAETLFTYDKYFQGSCYQMIIARSLTQAREALQVFRPVAILLDILLDRQSTWTFIAEMKGNEATNNIPIIVITVIDNETKARALGADEFLIKPAERLPLLNKVNALVKGDLQQKVLIIDNDQVARYLLKEHLANTNFTIIEADSGREGLALAQAENPQAIFLDLEMPEMNGFEVLKQLENNLATRNIPVIVNSSKLLEAEESRYLAQKAIAILSKESQNDRAASSKLREALVKAGLFLIDVS
ncbi:MAG TPA: ATP-binding protein [Kamptonema sp.]|nr:ATP-binding protein [Kamptonema sp.]